MQLGIVIFNGFDDASTELLTVLLGIKQEGTANKV